MGVIRTGEDRPALRLPRWWRKGQHMACDTGTAPCHPSPIIQAFSGQKCGPGAQEPNSLLTQP